MRTLTFFLLLAVCAVPARMSAQAAGNFIYNNPYSMNTDRITIPVSMPNANQVTLKAEVLMNVRATSFTAIFAATQTGHDVFQVDSLFNQRIAQVRYGLNRLGIPDDAIHVDAVSMVPTYSYQVEEKKFSKRMTEVPTGFEMKKNIHVLFFRHDVLDKIISEMAFADIYELVKVEYNLEGMNAYYDQVRDAAMKVIASKESTYNMMNFRLTATAMSDGYACTFPMERYKQYTAYYSGSSPVAVKYERDYRDKNNIYVSGKGNTVKVEGGVTAEARDHHFTIQTADKNKTIYYDRMPYNQFDRVLNPDFEEPAIQFYYTMQLTYTVMTEENWKKIKENEELQKAKQLTAQLQAGRKGRKARRLIRA
jgi:uncharacterized protein YggE